MRAFRKDFIREITKNKGRFLSVFFIVLLGAAFFSGIRSAEGDMKVSADRYYDEVNYMDLKVLGTLGLTDDDLADIAKTDGVKAVYGGKTVEVLHDIGESEQVVKLIALTDGVNEPRVVEGRMPEKEDEILVDTQFLKSSGCEIGDQVTFTSGTEDPHTEVKALTADSTQREWILALQIELIRQGYQPGTIDGIPGSRTLMGCPTVRKGAKGELTRWIQKRLSLYLNVWSEGGQTDGIFGEKTEQNIRNFQKTKGLSADGIVGEKTWSALLQSREK